MTSIKAKTQQQNIQAPVFDTADFYGIRGKLIDWLSNQDEFKDYDFAGSRLSVLIDLLAYNTLYIQHFTNMGIYESFIRTAKMRSSVVQHAQDMGYLPDSRSASGTTIAVTVKHPSRPTAITIPKGTKFIGIVDKTYPYDFVTWEDVIVLADKSDPEDVKYLARLNIHQGRIVRNATKFSNNSRIIIESPNIDRNYVRVFVDEAEWSDWTNNSVVNITGLSNVFYMRETLEGTTEIYFGEGEGEIEVEGGALTAKYVGGLRPNVGSTITVEYITTAGAEANGSTQINYVDSLTDLDFISIVENPDNDQNYTGTAGGGDMEDIERIRELAPVIRESQRRCVTATDYDSFISYRFGSIVQAIQTFTDPDKPGYAFIAIKPKDGLTLTTVQKEDMKNFLKEYNMAPITPIVMDPKYLYIKHNINVQYQLNALSESEEWLRSKIVDSIDRYYIENVEIFNKSFHASKMLTYVDSADKSVLGSSVDIKIVREEANFYKTAMAGVKFLNQVRPRSIKSSDMGFVSSKTLTYPIKVVTTDINRPDNVGLVLVGPFKDRDIKIGEYTGEDFDREVIEGRSKYYEIGTMDYVKDKMYYDMGILNRPVSDFVGSYIELEADPLDVNVYVRDGSLIVFENKLRPQYTTVTMEPIVL